jgi:hypothetical protein
MPTILKRSTASIARTRCWNTRSQESEPAVDATYKTNAPVSRAKNGLLSDELLAAVIFGVTEFILTYDSKPSYTVSIMEFKGDKVARETQYFADPFVAPTWRAQWVERMDT